jgi:hypothetical protein
VVTPVPGGAEAPPAERAAQSVTRDPLVGAAGAGSALDDTADLAPDTAISLTEALSRRAALFLVAQQTQQYKLQARLDRIKATFNASQEEHAEMLREMNALRDMALEQSKKDDEVLKKYIAQI